jgi:hypothetical protein
VHCPRDTALVYRNNSRKIYIFYTG